jgi:hypothetical protein
LIAGATARPRVRARPLVVVALAIAAGLASAAPASATLTITPPRVLDGPDASLVSIDGLAIARHGTGGLVYEKQVGGVTHVFLSRLLGGAFQTPQQVDVGLSGASSQAVVAAGDGGLLIVAFINGGSLYVVDWASSGAASTAPTVLFSGAANPSISSTLLGKVYLAFTAAGQGGHDVRCAYYYNGQWGIEPTPLDANPADDAGTGSSRPAVAASGDGVAIVAWGEAGHVYARRVWAMAPSVAYEQLDVPSLGGWSETGSDEPAVATGGDSTYADIVFHEEFESGVQQQSRVLDRRLVAGSVNGLVQPDGLTTPGPEGADQPDVSVGEYGQGFITSGRTSTHQVAAMQLNNNGAAGTIERVDSLQNTAMPDAITSSAGYRSNIIVWQQNPGALGSPDIRARFFDGATLEPEQVLSAPAMGPTDAADGLVAAGDIAADVAVAWIGGTGSSTELVTDQMYQPPSSFSTTSTSQYFRTAQPTLSWNAARDNWGPLQYVVRVDGAVVAQTTATSVTVPNAAYPLPLSQGSHRWYVTVTNPAGVSKSDKVSRFFIDTLPPVVKLAVTGRRRVGSVVHVAVNATDAPPPLPRSEASGIAKVQITFGDGHSYIVKRGKYHVYHRAGGFKVTVIVTDKAGNAATAVTSIRIAPKPKPKPKRRHGRRRR